MGNNHFKSSVSGIIQEQNAWLEEILKPTFALSEIAIQQQEIVNKMAKPIQQYQEIFSKAITPVSEQIERINATTLPMQQALSSMAAMTAQLSKPMDISGIQSAVSLIPSINESVLSSTTAVVSQYASAIDSLKSEVNWTSAFEYLSNNPTNSHLGGSTIDCWLSSSSEIVDNMVKQGWIDEDDSQIYNEPEIINSRKESDSFTISWSQEPLSYKILWILNFLAAITSITGINLIDIFGININTLDDAVVNPPSIHRELNKDEVNIITCQTDLLNDVVDKLSIEAFNLPSDQPQTGFENDFETV